MITCRLIENAKNDPTWDGSLNAELCPGDCNGCSYNIDDNQKKENIRGGLKFQILIKQKT